MLQQHIAQEAGKLRFDLLQGDLLKSLCLLVDNLLAATGQLLIFTNSQVHDQIDQHLSCEGKANFLI